MPSNINFHNESAETSSLESLTLSKKIGKALMSPASPLQPIYQVDSMIDLAGESNAGGIFLFETERHLVYTSTYTCTLCTICMFGCWICTIPSLVVTLIARKAAKQNRVSRAKVMFNIAFIFSFFGLILFLIQAGYLAWLIRYLLHRFLSK